MGQENHQIERLQLSKVGIGVLEPKPSKTQILMKGIIWQNNWECRKPPEVKAVGDVLLGCDQLNLHEISTPVLSSQAAATWDPSLVSQLLYLLFHDTNLLLDPDRKPESAGCLKAKCY